MQDADFGSAKFQAYYDNYNFEFLEQRKFDTLKDLAKRTDTSDPQKRLENESHLRGAELELAFLEQTIEQKFITIPGYQTAYDTIVTLADAIGQVAYEELKDEVVYKQFKVRLLSLLKIK